MLCAPSSRRAGSIQPRRDEISSAGRAVPPPSGSGRGAMGQTDGAGAAAEGVQTAGTSPPPTDALLAQLEAQARAFRALHEVAVASSGVLDPAALARLVVDRARDLLTADSAGLYMWSAEAELLRSLGDNDPNLEGVGLTVEPGQGAAGLAFQRTEPVA